MLRVALTGGIASGKSVAADVFRELQVPVIDTDRIARQVVEPGRPGLDALLDVFGDDILDETGRLDRQQLREIIFSDASARQRVNERLHPLILAEVERELARIESPYVVIEIPLLTETGLAGDFDRILVIDAADEIRMARLQERDEISAAEAGAALAAQAPREARLRLASEVVENNGSLDNFRAAILALHEQYLAAAKRFASPANPPSE